MKYTIAAFFLVVMLGLSTAHAQDAAPASAASPLASEDQVLGYLEQLVEWQRTAAALEPSSPSPRELIFEDTLQQNAIRVMRSGFTFARMDASAQKTDTAAPDSADAATPRARLMQRAQETDTLIGQLRTRLNGRGLTSTQRQSLQGQLKLALAKQELFGNVLSNINAASSGAAKNFPDRIANMARAIPELATNTPAKAAPVSVAPAAPSTAAADTAATVRPPTSILSLLSDLFSVARKQRELNDFAKQTTHLEATSRAVMKTMRTALDDITTDTDAEAAAVDAKVAQYKQIASVILPLGDATLWTTMSARTIEDWQRMLDERFESLLRQLGIHVLILAVTLAIPLIASEIARRATARYIADAKRKRQVNTARRIITALAVVMILLFNFISDFSSFATFAGFLTAGLAVALQSVLLSLVAHFLFYGRYGVRSGDRVRVGDVTGDIVQIGMMRFHLRELKETDTGELALTGKIVSFPNSVLFQPAAFYKFTTI